MRIVLPGLVLAATLAASLAQAQQPRASTPSNPFLAGQKRVLVQTDEEIARLLAAKSGQDRLSAAVVLYLVFEAINVDGRRRWCQSHGVDIRYYGAVFRKAYEPYTALATLRLHELGLDEADARAKVLPMVEPRVDPGMRQMMQASGLDEAALCRAFDDQADVAIETLQMPPALLAALQE